MKLSLKSTDWLQWATGFLILGKLMQSIWAINPVIEFLGYESWMTPLVVPWMPWENYATELYPILSERAASVWTMIYAIALIGVFLPGKNAKWLVYPGIALLIMDAIMAAAGQFYWGASILEKTLMWLTPICYLSARYEKDQKKWLMMARYGIAIVFLVHGLYALEVMPRPGYWTEMASSTLGLTHQAAAWLFRIAGLLDILAAIWLLARSAVPPIVWYYLIGWGLLTAFGRLSGFMDSGTVGDLLINWSYETLIRLPHGVVPLAVFTQLQRG